MHTIKFILFFSIWILLAPVMAAVGISSATQNKASTLNLVAVELRLVPRKLELNENPKILEQPYVAGARIVFRLEATNTSIEPMTLVAFDPYFQNRPNLLRYGELVEYRHSTDELVKAKENDPFRVMGQPINLQPSESRIIEYIRLEDWYDDLLPGRYELSLKHRFEPGQHWIEASSISFEVIARTERRSGE